MTVSPSIQPSDVQATPVKTVPQQQKVRGESLPPRPGHAAVATAAAASSALGVRSSKSQPPGLRITIAQELEFRGNEARQKRRLSETEQNSPETRGRSPERKGHRGRRSDDVDQSSSSYEFYTAKSSSSTPGRSPTQSSDSLTTDQNRTDVANQPTRLRQKRPPPSRPQKAFRLKKFFTLWRKARSSTHR